VSVELQDAKEKVLDTSLPTRFGFREFWIDGRDFYLNGTRIFLSCVPLDNAESSVALSSYERAKESMLRLKSIGSISSTRTITTACPDRISASPRFSALPTTWGCSSR